MRAGTICHGKLMLSPVSKIRKERTSEEKTMHDICKLHFNSIYKKHSKALAKLNHSHHLIPSHQSRANERSNNDLNSKNPNNEELTEPTLERSTVHSCGHFVRVRIPPVCPSPSPSILIDSYDPPCP